MRDATIKYLQSAFSEIKDIQEKGKKSDIFGYGTEDITFTKSGSFLELSNGYKFNQVLEYRNVTINEGVYIQGNTFYGNKYDGSIPFYLKVNGTLTVNGSLNMNGTGQEGDGQSHKSNYDAQYTGDYTGLGYELPYLHQSTPQLALSTWFDLYNYGKAKTFFDGKTCLIGAGCGQRTKYKKKSSRKNYYRHSFRTTRLNSGGSLTGRSSRHSGGGGGFIALYYENMTNQGPTWTDNTDAPTKGQTFYTNINCNGGRGGGGHTPSRWGGGCMIIAARNIVIGPKGSITSNPSVPQGRSVGASPDYGYYNNSLMGGNVAFMNRPSSGVYLLDYNDGKFTSPDLEFSGGGGIVFGYQITPEY